MKKIFNYTFTLCILILFFSCSSQKNENSYDGLVISQEQRASWSRNFNPLTPGGMARFPTTAGVYEPLMIYNSIKGKYIPWLAINHSWNKLNDTIELEGKLSIVLYETPRNFVEYSGG